MRDLKRRHRDELAARLLVDQGRAPGGARNILRALSAMFEDAITDELCDTNPWKGSRLRDDDRRSTKAPKELRVWTFAELHDFATAAGRYEPMIRTLVDCGLRAGELFALRREDLDLQAGYLTVRATAWEGQVFATSQTKNHDRDVPIAPGLAALLRQMPVRIDSSRLFSSPRGTLWRYSNGHRRVWQPTITAANDPAKPQARFLDPTPHELRHSWVTNLRAAGVDPADLADMGGHGLDIATSTYTHALRRSFDQVRRAVG
jgi:integrase